MSTRKLFTPITLGDIELKNRVLMAPMTRARTPTRVPNDSTVTYYAQRAGAGLIVTEATTVSSQGDGSIATPGIYTDEQVAGWRRVTDAVHERGGRIAVQLWHTGRVSHSSFQPGGGAPVSMMYGVVRFDHAAGNMLRDLLPPLVKVDTWNDDAGSWLHSTLRFIAREARDMRPGGETVITRLADIVVIEAIRRWLSRSPDANRGWLKAARDPQIGRSIVAIHRDPAASWSVETLAQVAGMSRSAFAARFTALVGKPAMQYLAEWRMNLARRSLRETAQPIATIAADLGYQSEPAFNRAFKRGFGTTPGQARRIPVATPS